MNKKIVYVGIAVVLIALGWWFLNNHGTVYETTVFDGPAFSFSHPKGWTLEGDSISMNIWSPATYRAQQEFLTQKAPGEGVLPNASITCGTKFSDAISRNEALARKSITTLDEYVHAIYDGTDVPVKEMNLNGEKVYQVVEEGLGQFEITLALPGEYICGFIRLIPGQGFNEYSKEDIQAVENLRDSIKFKK